MKLIKTIQTAAVIAATFGILLPQAAIVDAAELASQTRQVQTIKDIALGTGGVVRGQVVTKDGVADKGAIVSVARDGETIATTKADENGVFAIGGVQGGVYSINSGNTTGLVRAWSQNTAPPAASQAVLLVPSDLTVRGQGHLHNLLHNHNHLGGLSMAQIGLGGLLVLGLAGTIIAVSLDDDDAS